MPLAFIDNVPVTHNLYGASLTDAFNVIDNARKVTKGHVDQLRASIIANDAAAQQGLQNLLIHSPEAKLASAIAANKKLKLRNRRTLEDCLAVPSKLILGSPLSEPVPVRPEPKKSGGVRMLHNHGLHHRTAQDMVVRIMSAYVAQRPFQFTNRGLRAAIRETKKQLKAGHIYSARLDIRDFFPSFECEKLAPELPLPQEVVERVVLGRHMKVVMDKEFIQRHPLLPHHTHENLLTQARQGIPQGSASSPIVGAFCIGRLEWPSAPGVVLINYADDFLLLALSPAPLDEAVAKLVDAVANIPGGDFELKLKETSDVNKGFEFLGHSLQLIDGNLKTSPTASNITNIWGILEQIDTKLGQLVYAPGKHGNYDKAQALKCLAKMKMQGEGWLNAFQECDTVKREIEMLDVGVTDWCKTLHLSLDDVSKAADASMTYQPSDYALGH